MDRTVHHTHVCVGGHLDGQRHAPSKAEMLGPSRFRFHQRLTKHAPLTMAEAASPPLTAVLTDEVDEIYEAESIKLHQDGRIVEYLFWRARGIALHTAISMLFDGYWGKRDGK